MCYQPVYSASLLASAFVCVCMCVPVTMCKNCVFLHLLCTLCQTPCNIFMYLKVFGLFKVVEGFWSPRELG